MLLFLFSWKVTLIFCTSFFFFSIFYDPYKYPRHLFPQLSFFFLGNYFVLLLFFCLLLLISSFIHPLLFFFHLHNYLKNHLPRCYLENWKLLKSRVIETAWASEQSWLEHCSNTPRLWVRSLVRPHTRI